MFEKYFRKYSLNAEKLPRERAEKNKASVLSLIAKEEEMKKFITDSEDFVPAEPKKYEDSSKGTFLRFIPAVAAAAAIAAAIPVGVNFIRNDTDALSAGASVDFSENYNKEYNYADVPNYEYKEIKADTFLFNGKSSKMKVIGENLGELDVCYDGVFKAQGLAIDTDFRGNVVLTPVEENPDIYYFMAEFPMTVEEWAEVFDTDGNVLIHIGEGSENVKVEGKGLGERFYRHEAHGWGWNLLEGEEDPNIYLPYGGEAYYAIFRPSYDLNVLDRNFIKRWYSVTEKAKAILEEKTDGRKLRNDIFEDGKGGYIYCVFENFYKQDQLQSRVYGYEPTANPPDNSGTSGAVSSSVSIGEYTPVEADSVAEAYVRKQIETDNDGKRVIDIKTMDLDFDGNDEIVALARWDEDKVPDNVYTDEFLKTQSDLHIYNVGEDGVIEYKTVLCGIFSYIDKIDFYPTEYNGEKCYYYRFLFDHNGEEKCDVLSVIVPRPNDVFGYDVVHVASHVVSYGDKYPQKEFYRKGWDLYDEMFENEIEYISEDEYHKLCRECTGEDFWVDKILTP